MRDKPRRSVSRPKHTGVEPTTGVSVGGTRARHTSTQACRGRAPARHAREQACRPATPDRRARADATTAQRIATAAPRRRSATSTRRRVSRRRHCALRRKRRVIGARACVINTPSPCDCQELPRFSCPSCRPAMTSRFRDFADACQPKVAGPHPHNRADSEPVLLDPPPGHAQLRTTASRRSAADVPPRTRGPQLRPQRPGVQCQ